MLSLAVAVAISSSIMRAVSTLNESRFEPKYFTRNLKMPFERLLKFLLSMYKTSSQAALNKFFESKGITTDSPMRMHLLNHLSGNIAWRHPEDAMSFSATALMKRSSLLKTILTLRKRSCGKLIILLIKQLIFIRI